MKGDPVIDELMKPIRYALDRQGISGNARTNIYNRAYEAVIASLTVMDVMREQINNATARAEAAEKENKLMERELENIRGYVKDIERGNPLMSEYVWLKHCVAKINTAVYIGLGLLKAHEDKTKGGE